MSDDNKIINIEFLIDEYNGPFSGTEKQLLYLIENLDKEKYRTRLSVLRSTLYIENNSMPCDINILNITKIFSIQAIVRMLKYIRYLNKAKISIVHIFFIDSSIIAPIFLKLAGFKVIISRRDMGYWYSKINKFALNINRYFVDIAITNCHAVKVNTNKNEGIPLKNIHVIFNGHKFNKNIRTNNNEPIGKRLHKIKKQAKIIGIVANIRPIKRIDDLVYAFKKVTERHHNVALVIIGDGDTNGMTRIAKELSIDNSVYLLGKSSDAISLIKEFNVAVLCSESEGLSNSIIEYMICKIPVVCTSTGGNTELIEDGVRGLTVEVGDINGLASRLCEILEHEDIAIEMAENAYKYVYDNCEINRMLDSHNRIFTELCR